MNPLLELADRVEAATGPDRDLDFAIASLCNQHIISELRDLAAYPRGKEMIRRHEPFPAYTASLDGAMTLVPEGHTVQLSDWDHELLRKKGAWQAIVLPFGARGAMAEYTFSNRCDHAATPALALTAASLRAIASTGSSG